LAMVFGHFQEPGATLRMLAGVRAGHMTAADANDGIVRAHTATRTRTLFMTRPSSAVTRCVERTSPPFSGTVNDLSGLTHAKSRPSTSQLKFAVFWRRRRPRGERAVTGTCTCTCTGTGVRGRAAPTRRGRCTPAGRSRSGGAGGRIPRG
jgi:hypothetical protein